EEPLGGCAAHRPQTPRSPRLVIIGLPLQRRAYQHGVVGVPGRHNKVDARLLGASPVNTPREPAYEIRGVFAAPFTVPSGVAQAVLGVLHVHEVTVADPRPGPDRK